VSDLWIMISFCMAQPNQLSNLPLIIVRNGDSVVAKYRNFPKEIPHC